MKKDRPYNPAQAFQDRFDQSTADYVGNGYKAHDAAVRRLDPCTVEVGGNANIGHDIAAATAARELGVVSPSEWIDPPPDYNWIVEGCFLRGTVGMISGDGGVGKSLLLQQLCTAAALGRDWVGLKVAQCNALALFCEDDLDELHRRQHAINRHYGCGPVDLTGKLEYAARVGLENILVEFEQRNNRPSFTPLFEQLRAKILHSGTQIVVLDTVADIFDGNENIRNQVRRFITALRKIAMETRGLIILAAHPSLTGMNTGTGSSGSTGWNNSVRSRIYLTRPKRPEGADAEEEDNAERVLKTMKSNYSASGGKVRLRWEQGVFVCQDGAAGTNLVDQLEIDRLALDGLRQLVSKDTKVPRDPRAAKAFANVARKLQSCKHLSQGTLDAALDRLISSKKVEAVEMGPASKRRVYVRPSEMRYPGEVKAS